MSTWYMAGRTAVLRGDIDFAVDTIRAALVGPTFVFEDTDVHLSDVAGLLSIGHVDLSVTSVANGRVLVADVVMPNVGGTDHVRGLLVYRADTEPATSALIAFVDQRADTVPIDVEPNGGDLTFSFNYLVKV